MTDPNVPHCTFDRREFGCARPFSVFVSSLDNAQLLLSLWTKQFAGILFEIESCKVQ